MDENIESQKYNVNQLYEAIKNGTASAKDCYDWFIKSTEITPELEGIENVDKFIASIKNNGEIASKYIVKKISEGDTELQNYLYLAIIYDRINNIEASKKNCLYVLERNLESPEVYETIISVYSKEMNKAKVKYYARIALEKYPDNWEIYDKIIYTYFMLNEKKLMQNLIQRASTIFPDEQLTSSWQKLIKMKNDNLEVKDNILYYLRILGYILFIAVAGLGMAYIYIKLGITPTVIYYH
ncbi:MAG: hypothetical protein LKG27_02515 [Clostridiaceae bacterium]|jgi:tetratricopeptide (TPR) repeat protein|nr:hypothetical protein [Clostridiaceae bacterium]